MTMAASGSRGATPELAAEIETALEKAIERGEMRAAVAGVYADGETRLMTFGRLGRTDARRPDGDTAFEIGSVSKVFTALLAQVQSEAGRLDWDGPIAKYLPATEIASTAVAAITLRELATHTSGMPRVPDDMPMEDPLDPYAGYERDDLLSFLAGLENDTLEKTYG